MAYWGITRRIYLIRHTQTVANLEGIVVGKSDSPLTLKGKKQMANVVRAFENRPLEHLFTSPLERASLLAQEIAALKNLSTHTREEISEIDFGEQEGMLYSDIPRGPVMSDEEHYVRKIAPGGESREDLDRRVSAFTDELVSTPGNIAVVTHGGPLRSILVKLLDLRREDAWSFDVTNGSIYTVAQIGERWALHEIIVND